MVDSKGGPVVGGAKDGEDSLAVANNVKVGDVDEECVEDDDNIFGKDVQVSFAREQKAFDDLKRAMHISKRIVICGAK